MSDSDSESYEVIDGRFSPAVRNIPNKRRAMTHTGFVDRKSSSNSPVPPDIDSRPPYPTPKLQTFRPSNGPSNLTYDRITLSPVVPDYEVTSSSPPHVFNGSISPNSTTPPPLPPFNQKKRQPNRYLSKLLSVALLFEIVI